MDTPVLSKRYLIMNEILNAITHGIGFGLSIAGLVLLLIKGAHHHSAIEIIAYSIYGSSMILLFLMSTLYHSLIFTKAKKVFQVFDHCSIYLLIAGSYTPYCLITIRGWLGTALFFTVWIIAVLGLIYKSIWLKKKSVISTIIYIILGWLCVVAIPQLYHGLGIGGVSLLALGGVAYTVGALFYSLHFRYMHVVWHLFVMLGAALMYFSVLFYV